MEWISVKDRLPEELPIDRYNISPWVLVYLEPFGFVSFGRYKNHEWELIKDAFTTWDHSFISDSSNVTHWMNIPSNPKELNGMD